MSKYHMHIQLIAFQINSVYTKQGNIKNIINYLRVDIPPSRTKSEARLEESRDQPDEY
ncbi:hypothetical protein CY34DRAFT_801218 [Suillus luteus UH-Slu-Lm8-n1]|uniref:Uncharacterized protein n=1 Tax=Suillus luteus UH-Slu-Lm8-n1 TaxID=930992 RepID=A0A0D0AVK0_9AGAM|nr:hypothetical protein CY34DRAFT_801218 [Suillus luteus UH-Slu-Lm8-n1]